MRRVLELIQYLPMCSDTLADSGVGVIGRVKAKECERLPQPGRVCFLKSMCEGDVKILVSKTICLAISFERGTNLRCKVLERNNHAAR